ncbi:MAG: hypothetical protein PUC65_07455 [Clostridiales bacterium]|nr:hypothetical protein [Clostridiales bacterium]
MVIREIEMSDAASFWNMQFELDKETKFMMYEPNERTKNLESTKNMIQEAIDGSNLLLIAENEAQSQILWDLGFRS